MLINATVGIKSRFWLSFFLLLIVVAIKYSMKPELEIEQSEPKPALYTYLQLLEVK